MFAVIFRAEVNNLDDEYVSMAKQMRELAIDKYGCLEFTSAMEGKYEIAISYWENEQQIKLWKQDAEHLVAQEWGATKWYKSYKVQVVEIMREYGNDS